MAINTETMPWGTIIEMMPGARESFRAKKSYDAIYLGPIKGTNRIAVICNGNRTVQRYHEAFWRQKI